MNKLACLLAGAATVSTLGMSNVAFAAEGQDDYATVGLYGFVRASFQIKDDDNAIQDEASRFGIRGEADISDNLKGMWKFEFGYTIDEGSSPSATGSNALYNRLGEIGLKGNFGEVKMGKIWSPSWTHVLNRHIIFNAIPQEGGFPLDSREEGIFYGNKFGPVGFAALMRVDDGTDDTTGGHNIAINTKIGDLFLGLAAHQDDNNPPGTTEDDDTAIVASYGMNNWYVSGYVKDVGGDADDTQTSIGGRFKFGGGHSVYFRTSTWDNAVDADGTAIGYGYKFSKAVSAYVENFSEDIGDASYVGMRINFKQ